MTSEHLHLTNHASRITLHQPSCCDVASIPDVPVCLCVFDLTNSAGALIVDRRHCR